jgi:hypothetical protein
MTEMFTNDYEFPIHKAAEEYNNNRTVPLIFVAELDTTDPCANAVPEVISAN